MNNHLAERFGGVVRLRICGLLKEENKVLLVKHTGLGVEGFLWSPPGGGAHFGESFKDTLMREFLEETNLEIEVGDFLFFNEHIGQGIHAMELFFQVFKKGGEAKLGFDPELPEKEQMLCDLAYWAKEEIESYPEGQFHKKWRNFFS